MAFRRGLKWNETNSRLDMYVNGTRVMQIDNAAPYLTVLAGLTVSGGASKFDGGAFTVNDDSGDYDFRIEGASNANLVVVDAGQDAISLGGANVDGAALTLNNLTDRTAITAVGHQLHIPAQTTNFDNGSETVAVGAAAYIGIPTYTGDTSTLTMTDLAALWVDGAPVDGSNVTGTRSWAVYINANDLGLKTGNVRLGPGKAAFGTTEPTQAVVLDAGTAPAGAIATSSGIYASTTVLRKFIADGTLSSVG